MDHVIGRLGVAAGNSLLHFSTDFLEAGDRLLNRLRGFNLVVVIVVGFLFLGRRLGHFAGLGFGSRGRRRLGGGRLIRSGLCIFRRWRGGLCSGRLVILGLRFLLLRLFHRHGGRNRGGGLWGRSRLVAATSTQEQKAGGCRHRRRE